MFICICSRSQVSVYRTIGPLVFLSMYGLVALCYRLIQNISYTKQFVALVKFFFSSLSDFFSRFSLVAVCHRRIHQNFYIKPFVALVRLFSLPFLIFFFKTLSCCSLLRTDTKYYQYENICRTCYVFIFSPV